MPATEGGSGDHGRDGGGEERPGPTPVRDAGTSNGSAPTPARAAMRATRDPAGDGGGPLQVVQVRFKGLRTEHFSFRHRTPLREREFVIVEADRGRDLGRVKRALDADSLACEGGCDHGGDQGGHHPVVPPPRRILRRAAPADVLRLLQLRDQELEVRRRTRSLVEEHGLRMKVSEAEWQWDRNKLTVYFTAEKRVDFRALVRAMARTFRTRIELRQIGVRDEARRLGGIGRCRRELCCRSWLADIQPVTLQLAKDQGLSLNPSQISGACGRLMNCLHYEHGFYQQAKKRFPPVGRRLQTSRGEEEVTAHNLFREMVTLRDRSGDSRTIPLEQLKGETLAGRREARDD